MDMKLNKRRSILFAIAAQAMCGCSALVEILDALDQPPAAKCGSNLGGDDAVRLIAFSPVFSPESMTHPTDFIAAFAAAADEYVVKCLSAAKPNIVVLPDNLSDVFAIVGARADAVRAAPDFAAAGAGLYAAYETPILGYKRRFPTIDDTRALGLALSNPIRMLADKTAGDLARQTGALVAIGLRLPEAQNPTSNISEHALFGDIEFDPVTVYVAAASSVVEASFVYDDTGQPVVVLPRGFGGNPHHIWFGADRADAAKYSTAALPVSDATGERTLRVMFWGAADTGAEMLGLRTHDLAPELLLTHGVSNGLDTYNGDVWLPVQRFGTLAGGAVAYLRATIAGKVYDGQNYIAQPGISATTFEQPPAVTHTAASAVAEIDIPRTGAYGSATSEIALHRRRPAAAAPENNLIVTWSQEVSGQAEPHWGVPVGSEIEDRGAIDTVTTRATAPRIAATADGVIAVWSQGAAGNERIRIATCCDGDSWSPSQLANPEGTEAQWWPTIAANDESFVVVWNEFSAQQAHLAYRLQVTAADVTVGSLRSLDSTTAPSQVPMGPAAVTWANEQIWAAWPEQAAGGEWLIFLDRIDMPLAGGPEVVTTVPIGVLVDKLDLAQSAEGHIVAVWSEISADRRQAAIVMATRFGPHDFEAVEISGSESGLHLEPAVLRSGDTIWAAWRQSLDDTTAILVWSFSETLGPRGPLPIATSDPFAFGPLRSPALVPSSQGALIFWEDGASGSSTLHFRDAASP